MMCEILYQNTLHTKPKGINSLVVKSYLSRTAKLASLALFVILNPKYRYAQKLMNN